MDQRHKCGTWNTENAERKHRQSLYNIGVGKALLNRTPSVQELSSTTDKWNFIKLMRTAKETVNWVMRSSMEWERIFASNTSDKILISRICKELENTLFNCPGVTSIFFQFFHIYLFIYWRGPHGVNLEKTLGYTRHLSICKPGREVPGETSPAA